MSPTKVIGVDDATDPEQMNVPALQHVLDHITENIDSWQQGDYAYVPHGADRLTERDLKEGVYHDFVLEPETVEYLRGKISDRLVNVEVPINTCGTAFCVAGDLAVQNGWTFVIANRNSAASTVVPTPLVNAFLRDEHEAVNTRAAHDVAREILNVDRDDARSLFAGSNSIFDIWMIGYALSDGRLTLPDSLPATDTTTTSTPAVDGADAVRDAINLTLGCYAWYYRERRFAHLVDVNALETMFASHSVADGAWDRYGREASRNYCPYPYRDGVPVIAFIKSAQNEQDQD